MMSMLRSRHAALAVAALLSLASCAGGSGSLKTETTPPPTVPAAAANGDARFDAVLSEYAYPNAVQFYEVPYGGVKLRMAYMDVRPQQKVNGKVVLLLHGKNFGAFYWAKTIELLVGDGYRVIAPDQIGFGKSDKPHDYSYSFAAFAANTKGLLDLLAVPKVEVVGHSMGGMLATRFALMYPERTRSLALVNPIGLEDWSVVVPYRSVDEWYERELKATPDSIRSYQKASYYDGNWKPEYEALIEAAAGQTQHPDYPKVAWASARTYEMIFTQPVVYELSRLAVPTMLLIGLRDRTALGKDAVSPEVAKKLGDYPVLGAKAAAAIKGSTLVTLPGIGHVPQVEAWEAYGAALKTFLAVER